MKLVKHEWDDSTVQWLEEDMQAACVTALYRIERVWGHRFTFAGDMNAEKRSPAQRAKAKATGMRAGEADLRFYLPEGTLWLVELKRRGNGLTEAQKIRHPTLTRLGHAISVITCDTPYEAVMEILSVLATLLKIDIVALKKLAFRED